MKTKSPLNRTMQLAVKLAFLALLGVGMISYRTMLAAESGRRPCHAQSFLENFDNLFSAAQSVASSYRGLALGGIDPRSDSVPTDLSRSRRY
jgi:hypothetical protein